MYIQYECCTLHTFIYICILCLFLCSNNIVNMEQGGKKSNLHVNVSLFFGSSKEENLKQIVITVNRSLVLPTVAK